ncbi:Aspartic proteinase CDR1 [Linum grandiflorum]
MAPKPPLITIFFFFFCFFKYSHSLGLTTRLIHHDSIFSPFYNASETTADRAWRATRSSLARADYLSSRASQSLSSTPVGIHVKLVEATSFNAFYVNFSIGYPKPVPQLAIMDTGSDFLWVKCLPCTPCEPMDGVTYFDPSRSFTYSPAPCTEICKKCVGGRWPWSPRHCMYRIDYTPGYHSEGIYATEELTFRTSDGKTTYVQDIQFGCGTTLTGPRWLNESFNGVFGLSIGNPDSLLTQPSFFNQFHWKFSYSIGDLNDPTYPDHQLAFGDAARLTGIPTVFFFYDSQYHVHLANISFGDKMLDIDVKVFDKISSWRQGVVIDSGITLLHLYTKVYHVVKDEIEKVGSRMFESAPPPSPPYELCYKGHVDQDPIGFPILKLHFGGDATLAMDVRSIFRQISDDLFCVAIVESKSVTYIGIMAQQSHNVGFDLANRYMYLDAI